MGARIFTHSMWLFAFTFPWQSKRPPPILFLWGAGLLVAGFGEEFQAVMGGGRQTHVLQAENLAHKENLQWIQVMVLSQHSYACTASVIKVTKMIICSSETPAHLGMSNASPHYFQWTFCQCNYNWLWNELFTRLCLVNKKWSGDQMGNFSQTRLLFLLYFPLLT